MSRDWTTEELQAASRAMKSMGHMGYEEFCNSLQGEGGAQMEINYAVTGDERKKMVQVISEVTNKTAVYKKTPTYAYEIGDFTVSKEGVLIWAEDTAEDEVLAVTTALRMMGFKEIEKKAPVKAVKPAVKKKADKAVKTEPESENTADTLNVQMPLKMFDEQTFANLDRLIEGKGNLIRKAIGADSLEYVVEDDKVCFPWFTLTGDADEATAYTHLISKLVEQARTCKKVLMKEKVVENEKYAFRCFLLRIGFIGEEYKATRRVLLRNLKGNASWKDDRPK